MNVNVNIGLLPYACTIRSLKRMRADESLAKLPVVMVTTETEMEHMAAAMTAGANEYVMKPFTREILLDKLRMIGIGC